MKTDNEWAAEVMGWERPPEGGPYWDTQDDFRTRPDWNPATDANDFRELLNCQAVRNRFPSSYQWNVWVVALDDQPAALRRLREVMEGEG